MPKYSVNQTVRFSYKGKEYTGTIQGIKEGPLYLIWVGDKWGWVTAQPFLIPCR